MFLPSTKKDSVSLQNSPTILHSMLDKEESKTYTVQIIAHCIVKFETNSNVQDLPSIHAKEATGHSCDTLDWRQAHEGNQANPCSFIRLSR